MNQSMLPWLTHFNPICIRQDCYLTMLELIERLLVVILIGPLPKSFCTGTSEGKAVHRRALDLMRM